MILSFSSSAIPVLYISTVLPIYQIIIISNTFHLFSKMTQRHFFTNKFVQRKQIINSKHQNQQEYYIHTIVSTKRFIPGEYVPWMFQPPFSERLRRLMWCSESMCPPCSGLFYETTDMHAGGRKVQGTFQPG